MATTNRRLSDREKLIYGVRIIVDRYKFKGWEWAVNMLIGAISTSVTDAEAHVIVTKLKKVLDS